MARTKKNKTQRIQIRLTDLDLLMLTKYSDRAGVDRSKFITLLIRKSGEHLASLIAATESNAEN
jgi:hypothetical protein